MVERLLKYQREYGQLSKEDKAAHISALDTDPRLRKEVAELARHFLHREVSNCGWCYIEFSLMLLKITKEQMEKKTLAYELLPGTVLHDPINKDFSKLLTPGTLTEDLALYHIAFNKNAMKYFVRVPGDLEERLTDYLDNQGGEELAEARQVGEIRIEALERQVASALQAKQIAKARYDKATKDLEAVEAKLDDAKAGLDKAAVKERVAASDKPEGSDAAEGKEAAAEEAKEDEANEDFLAAAKEDVATYIAAGMTNKQIEEAFEEAIADKKVTKSQLVKFAAEARAAATGDGAPAEGQGAAEGDGAPAAAATEEGAIL